MPIRGILLIAFYIISLPVCFVRPFYGILLWTATAYVNPQWYTWSAARSLPWAMLVAVPTLAGIFIFRRSWAQRLRSGECLFMIALWVWFTITSVISTHTPMFVHHEAETWYRWEFVSKILLMALATVAVVDSFDKLRGLVLVTAGCFSIFIMKALPFMIRTGGAYRLYGPPKSMIEDNNDFGLALNMILPFFFFLAQAEPRRWVRAFFRFVGILTIPAVFFTYSRGALLGLIAVLIVMTIQSRQRKLLLIILPLGLAVALAFAPESWRHRMDPTRPDAIDESARSRLNAWTYSWRLSMDYPIAGGGFDTFTPKLFGEYAPNGNIVHGPHSVYFGVLAEHGFVGLLLYGCTIAAFFISGRRVSVRARSEGNWKVVQYSMMLRLSVVGFLVSGAFLGRAYFDLFFMMLSLMAILKHISYTDTSEADDEDLENDTVMTQAEAT